MADAAHFSVDTRLTRLLGETYRSSEVAIKELVDNAWDADAENVWVILPEPLSADPLIVKDDGAGMTSQEMRGEYLNIASDKRTRTGERTPKFNRRIKGRKGIGKFAGLTIASVMHVEATSRGRKCTLTIDKKELTDNQNDLEAVSLPFLEEDAEIDDIGTKVTLSNLDDRLNFPTSDRLREILIQEYGREQQFVVHVNKAPLSIEDMSGETREIKKLLENAGETKLTYTISDSKKAPRSPGIVIKVGGKIVGKPQFFGLEDDEEIPPKLLKKIYGEIEVDGIDDFVTADWGAVIENSKAYQETECHIRQEIKDQLRNTHARDMSLQKARLQQRLNRRLEKLPQYRRQYAEESINRILGKFYGESDDRIAVIANVALDAMEHDAYWAVLENINNSSHGDIETFASALEKFGLVEIFVLTSQAKNRMTFLDFLEMLVSDPTTLEKNVHQAIENNLWLLGRNYSSIASNSTLKSIINDYCNRKFVGEKASNRPDLLLAQNQDDSFLLIEFKRPSHYISRKDINQAEEYRDTLSAQLASTAKIEILMIGKGRIAALNPHQLAPDIKISSYASVISSSRSEINWLLKSLSDATT